MSTVYEHTRTVSHRDALVALGRMLHDFVEQYGAEFDRGMTVRRLAVRIDPLEPTVWLAVQRTDNRMFWSGRDGAFHVAGIGTADCVTGSDRFDADRLFDAIRTRLGSNAAETRYYGGARFDCGQPDSDHWRPFGIYQFILPRFEVWQDAKRTELVCNFVPGDAARLDEILPQLHRIVMPESISQGALPALIRRVDTPDRDGWMATVAAALELIRATELEKIVLARESRFDFVAPPDAVRLMTLLRARTGGCFHFLFQPDQSTAFFGATPERLYARTGGAILSEALAGTRPRGESDDDDQRLGEKLLSSGKETREHGYVAASTRRVLTELCRTLSGGEQRSLVKLARVQHMIARFEGELDDGIGDIDILPALHPTPAVGGVPSDLARQRIAELEHFDRGWYAGPVGWVGCDSAEFAVGIRSALLRGEQLRLFSGAGIVEGSHPDREWDEIENKIGSFLKIFPVS